MESTIQEFGDYRVLKLLSESKKFYQRYQTQCFLLVTIVIASLGGLNMMPSQWHYHDESFHFPQIELYISGIYTEVIPQLTMIPGYHASVALLSKLFMQESVDFARTMSFVLSLPALLMVYLNARVLNHKLPALTTLVFFLCPIIFPYFYIIYTDIPSLGLVLTGLYLTLNRRYQWAALVLGVSILFRQTNIMWLFLCWLLALSEGGFFRNLLALQVKPLLMQIKSGMFFLVICLAFVAFVIINGGVAIGDAGQHQLNRLYITQPFMCLFVMFFIFLPWHILNTKKIIDLVRRRPEILFIVSVLFVVYISTFWAYHGYNDFEFFLRNRVVMWVRQDFWTQSLAFVVMAWAFLSLLVTPFRKPEFYWLYPVAVLSMLPHGLIEQRYFIEFLVLFILFRKPECKKADYLTVAMYVPVTLFLCTGIGKIQFFL